MENFQHKRVRLSALARHCISAALLCSAAATAALAQPGPSHRAPLRIPGVQQGKAVLTQNNRVTTLVFTPTAGKPVQIPLLHDTGYPQGTNAPYQARVIAEAPGQYLIFTDTFASNPGNIQGECGASPTGERFLHVVSLPQAKETFSMLIASCLQDIETKPTTPDWNPVKHILTLRFVKYDGHKLHDTYQIGPDGSVQELTTP